ncbi:MAG: hypothetical protein LBJ14_00515 [Desulfarculales bacterium]|jgi:hypothetical protein|nr:hypothetical protein [Desulfarculales bacterium]
MNQRFFLLLLAIPLAALAGCLPSPRPAITTNFYIFDYPPPHFVPAPPPLPAAVRVERFTSSQEFNTQDMIFSPRPGIRQNYNYSRWRIYPADICYEYLLRDLRAGALFQAVLPNTLARFKLEGAVEEILLANYGPEEEDSGYRVRLTLNCALLDGQYPDLLPSLLFQRSYRGEEKVEDGSPLAMALGLSKAMENISRSLQEDIYQALERRLEEEKTD